MRFTIAVSLCMLISFAAGATTLSISPATQSVNLGATVTASVNIVGLGNHSSPALGTYDLNIAFDPAILKFSSLTYGDPLLGDELNVFGLGDVQTTTPGSVTVEAFELSLDSASDLVNHQPSGFTLFQISFITLANGASPLSISINAVGDENGNSLPAAINNGAITVGNASTSTVPEPATLGIMAAGLIGLIIVNSRRVFLQPIIAWSRPD